MSNWIFRAEWRQYANSVALYGFTTPHLSKRIGMMKEILCEERDEAEPLSPFVEIDRTDAHSLMDALWEAGIRPSKKIEEASQIEAVKYHLEDMRRLVFKDE